MVEYRISGIWKNGEVITHYAVHLRTKNANGIGYTIGYGVKMDKAAAVRLLQNSQNSAKTYLWNYTSAVWSTGGDVHVVNENPPFLRTTHDGTVKDNLLHLIDCDWIRN
jgi:hypothetical protein